MGEEEFSGRSVLGASGVGYQVFSELSPGGDGSLEEAVSVIRCFAVTAVAVCALEGLRPDGGEDKQKALLCCLGPSSTGAPAFLYC